MPAPNPDAWQPSVPRLKEELLTPQVLELIDRCTRWPLGFSFTPPPAVSDPTDQPYWSHLLYRGPSNQPVRVSYAKSRAESEALAQQFLHAPVVGFDMEWPAYSHYKTPQTQIAMIQVACEDHIALFHLGVHRGNTVEAVLSPTLRRLIESDEVLKAGVNITGADFPRLRTYFSLSPKAAVELGDLHTTVSPRPTTGGRMLWGMAHQVQVHLGLPLRKEAKTRKSNWHLPLEQRQIDYAAADAYAGFVLFHCLNAKRLAMTPVPPLIWGAQAKEASRRNKEERRRAKELTEERRKAKELAEQGGGAKEAAQEGERQQQVAEGEGGESESSPGNLSKKPTTTVKMKPPDGPLDSIASSIFDSLKVHRSKTARLEKVPPYCVAHDRTLENIARCRPSTVEQLLEVPGVGQCKAAKYGAEWLEMVLQFSGRQPEAGIAGTAPFGGGGGGGGDIFATRDQPDLAELVGDTADSAAHVAGQPCDSRSPAPPTLHTGVSFIMSSARISGNDEANESEDAFETMAPMRKRLRRDASPQPARPSEDDEAPLAQTLPFARAAAPGGGALDGGAAQPDPLVVYPILTPAPDVQPAPQAPSPAPDILSAAGPGPAREGTAAPSEPAAPAPRYKLEEILMLRKKMIAFTRRVAHLMKPASLTNQEAVVDRLVAAMPRSRDEMDRVPGIQTLADACVGLDLDLWATFDKFVAAGGLRGPKAARA